MSTRTKLRDAMMLLVGGIGVAVGLTLLHSLKHDSAPDWTLFNFKQLLPVLIAFALLRLFSRDGVPK